METCKVNGIDIFNPIQEKQIDRVIDYMVDFYGEKYRKQITENVKWAKFCFVGQNVGCQNVTSVSVLEYYNKKYHSLAKEFYGELGVNDLRYGYLKQDFSSLLKMLKNIEKELLRGNINDREEFKKYLLNGISCFYPLQNFFPQLSKQTKPVSFISSPDDMQIETLMDEQANDDFAKSLVEFFIKGDNLNHTIDLVKKMQSKYNFGYRKRVDKISKDAEGKVQFLINKELDFQRIFFNCQDEIKKIIVEYFASVKKQSAWELLKDPNIDNYCSYFIDILDKNPEFYTVYDKNNYIKLAMYLGLIKDANEIDIDKMLEDEKFDSVMRNKATFICLKELRKKIAPILLKKDWYIQKALEYVPIEDLPYVEFNINNFMLQDNVNGLTFSFCSVIDSKIRKSYCLFNQYTKLSDHTFVHEINHLANISKETSKVNKECGFNYANGDGETSILDEVVNEYFTCKIMDKMKEDNFKMFEYEEENPVMYSFVFPVIAKFIDKHQDLFIKCKLEGDVYKFSKIIGDDNFSKLNDMIVQYMELNMEYAQYKFGYENGLIKQYFDFLKFRLEEQNLELLKNRISLFLKSLESNFEKNGIEDEKYYE